MSALVAGVDLATQHARVVIVDAQGAVLASATAPFAAPQRPLPGRAEQDAGSWWPAVAGALRQATERIGRRASEIVAITPTATSTTIVAVDRAGNPTGPALLYDDRRAVQQAMRAQELGRDRWAACGVHIAPSFSLAKIAWLADAGLLPPGTRVFSSADLVVDRLTGAAMADWSHALKSGYDLVRDEWASDVHEALGLSPGLLPPVGRPGQLAGVVSAAAAAETGLPSGCRVHLGMTDGCTAQIACGAVAPGRFVSVLGTTLVIKGVSDRLVHDPTGAVYNHRHPDGSWLPGGASNTGGEALSRVAAAELPALDAAAAAHGPARVVTYPLARTGERFPFLAPQAVGFTLGTPNGEVEDHRARLEGVAFVERLAYEHLGTLGAPARGSLSVAGGASASAPWNRIRATVLDRPLIAVQHPESAFGAALLAAGATLHDGLAAATAAMVHPRATFEPVAAERSALGDSYDRFVEELRTRGWLDAPEEDSVTRLADSRR